MAALPTPADPTLAAMDMAIEAAQDRNPRPYLGASSIGDPCSRKLWYGMRWASGISFKASTLYLFDDGHRGEGVQADRLHLVDGVTLSTHADDGKQWGIEDHHGHFRGHCDGFIKGLLQAPKTVHVWEHKQANETKYKKLIKLKKEVGEKEALAHWDEVYYAQAQVYMHKFEVSRHYLTCATPGNRLVTSVRTNYNKDHAQALMDKAKAIIASDSPPTRLSEDSTFWKCKWCDHHPVCHDIKPEQINCRTCAHSYPAQAGTWACNKHGELSIGAQKMACPDYEVIA